jgi:hypothetical protein
MPDDPLPTPLPEASNDRIKELTDKYTATLKQISEAMKAAQAAIQERAEELIEDAQQKFKFDLTLRSETKTFKLNVPQVAMRERKISWDTPFMELKPQDWKFSTPSVRMKSVKVGQYPEFHGFTIVWKDIIVDVPEPFMQEQSVVISMPEFRMDTVSYKVSVPEFTWAETQFKLDLPELVVGDISFVIPLKTDEVKAKGEQIKADALKLAEETKQKYAEALKDYQHSLGGGLIEGIDKRFDPSWDALMTKREEALKEFDKQLQAVRAIKDTPAAAADPALMQQMLQKEQDLLASQVKATADIDAALANLQREEDETVKKASESDALKETNPPIGD